MNEERMKYNEIRDGFLECYYLYCRHKIHSFNMTGSLWVENESERGYAYEQSEYSHDSAIESLMLEVLSLIMIAGRGPKKTGKYHMDMIEKILAAHPLDKLLEEITEKEKSDLLYDMSLLGLLDKQYK